MDGKTRDVPPEAAALIGRPRENVFEVTARDIRHYIDAIGAPSGPDNDDELVAPPLFHHVLMFEHVPASTLRPDGLPLELDLPLPSTHMVGGAADIEIHRQMRPGDVVTVSSVIDDVVPKTGRSGQLYIVNMTTTYTERDGEILAVERSTFINR